MNKYDVKYADKEDQNMILKDILYTRYKDIAISRFKWDNLPDGLTSEIIEKGLFDDGKLLAFKDDMTGFLILKCHPAQSVNVYGEFTEFRAWGYNYHKTVKATDSVLIRNNVDMRSSKEIVLYYLEKMADIDLVCDVNVNSHATPFIIQGSSKTLFSLKNMWRKIRNREPVLIMDKKINLQDLTVHKTDAPYVIDKLCDYYNTLENRLLTILGINNNNTDKKERLLLDEVNSNNQLISSYLQQQFDYRKKACKEINEKFGLNITVSILTTELDSMSEQQKEREDGTIYRNPTTDTKAGD